jgi:hypothetical protein
VLYARNTFLTTLPNGKEVEDTKYLARIAIHGDFEMRDDVHRWFPGTWGEMPEVVSARKDLPATAQAIAYHEVFGELSRPAHNLIAHASNIADRNAKTKKG